jgi:hypothetical protein
MPAAAMLRFCVAARPRLRQPDLAGAILHRLMRRAVVAYIRLLSGCRIRVRCCSRSIGCSYTGCAICLSSLLLFSPRFCGFDSGKVRECDTRPWLQSSLACFLFL